MPTYPDTELLQRVAEADQQAFRLLFDRYKDRFYAVALKMTRSGEAAEDIVQELFVTLWLKRHLLATVEKPSTYLFTILYNSIYSHFTRMAAERRLKHALLARAHDPSYPFEDLLLEKEYRELLERAIANLPAQQQAVYRLSRLEGLPREDIAARLGIAPNTVKNHLAQALRTLADLVERALPLLVWILFRRDR